MSKKRTEAEVHSTRIIKIPVHIKPVQEIPVQPKKRTFSRCDLPNGDFLMNYYYATDINGNYIPEDIDLATHYERVVFDRDGNTIGSTFGRLTDKVRW